MPDWTDELRQRLATLRLSPTRETEIVEELAQHLDQRYEELRAAGRTDADARRVATLELDDSEALARHMRQLRQAQAPPPMTPGVPSRGSWSRELWQDLRYAARALRRQPGFALVAILTLALGIGANSAIFALVDATLLRPLPFGDPDRIVMLYERSATSARGAVSPLNMTDWNTRNRTFEVIAGYIDGVGGMVMTGADGLAENVSRQWVTAGFFDALGIRPIAGRTFLSEDDTRRASVVVLSEAFWRSRFDADPDIIGRDVRFDGAPFTVVGVVPRHFQLLAGTSIWAVRPILGAPPAVRSLYQLQRDWTDEAGRHDRGGERRPRRRRRWPRAGVSRDEQGPRHHGRAVARGARRTGTALHLAAVRRRGRLRPVDLLRQRRQSPARPRRRTEARAGRPIGARRRARPSGPAAAHRKPSAVTARRRRWGSPSAPRFCRRRRRSSRSSCCRRR